jgi:hypothetical protein
MRLQRAGIRWLVTEIESMIQLQAMTSRGAPTARDPAGTQTSRSDRKLICE